MVPDLEGAAVRSARQDRRPIWHLPATRRAARNLKWPRCLPCSAIFTTISILRNGFPISRRERGCRHSSSISASGALFGLSTGQYLTRARIEFACDRLRRTDVAISIVAQECRLRRSGGIHTSVSQVRRAYPEGLPRPAVTKRPPPVTPARLDDGPEAAMSSSSRGSAVSAPAAGPKTPLSASASYARKNHARISDRR